MDRRYYINLPALLILCFWMIQGCAGFTAYGRAEHRAQAAYSAGNYEEAVKQSVQALSINPQLETAEILLEKSFIKAIPYYERRIEEYTVSEELAKWDKIIREYQRLDNLVKTVQTLDLNGNEVLFYQAGVKDYSALITTAKNQAAEDYYQHGIQVMEGSNNRDSKRKAADAFRAAQFYVKDYKDSETLYETARNAGVLVIAVTAFENKSGKTSYGNLGEILTSQILSELISDKKLSEFVEFVRRDQIEEIMREQELAESGLAESSTIELGNILEAHQLLTGTINSIRIRRPQVSKDRVRLEETVIIDKENYTDNEGKRRVRNVYGSVTARVTYYNQDAGADVDASCSIVDIETGKILFSESFTGSLKYSYDWATYTGDKRALNSHARSLTNRSQKPEPVPDELVNQAMQSLQSQIVTQIRNYLK